MKELTEKEFEHLRRALKFGTKGKCAESLGIKAAALSRYLKPGSQYDVKSKRFRVAYIMPDHIYNGILKFVNQL